MKIAVIADIHGNYPAFKAVVDNIQLNNNVDHWLIAGDICGHFPMVNEVIDLLRDLNAVCVLGNHDQSLISNKNLGLQDYAFACVQKQRSIITPENLKYLKELPTHLNINLSGNEVEMFHGGPTDPLNQRINSIDANLIKYAQNKILIFGHNHKLLLHVGSDEVILSPSSCGFPRMGFKFASAIVYNTENKNVAALEVPYPKDELLQQVIDHQYDERYITALQTNVWPPSVKKNSKDNVIIVGASVYGYAIAELLKAEDKSNLVGYIDDTEKLQNQIVRGTPVLGKIADAVSIAEKLGAKYFFIGMGDNLKRQTVGRRLQAMGLRLGKAIHPRASVSPSATLGDGTVVDALAFVGPDASIGQGVSIWPGAVVCHDCIVGDFGAVMPGALIAGYTKTEPMAKVPTGSIHPAYSQIPYEASEL